MHWPGSWLEGASEMYGLYTAVKLGCFAFVAVSGPWFRHRLHEFVESRGWHWLKVVVSWVLFSSWPGVALTMAIALLVKVPLTWIGAALLIGGVLGWVVRRRTPQVS